jgi:hypothetical protein
MKTESELVIGVINMGMASPVSEIIMLLSMDLQVFFVHVCLCFTGSQEIQMKIES